MTEQALTREFSICLLPDIATSEDIDTLRQTLPESPYRDDIPHITLLRGITASSDVTDAALAHNIELILSPSSKLPLEARVHTIENRSNQLYSSSGIIILQASPELVAFRKEVARKLLTNKYQVEPQELSEFIPHITIRLGVPLDGNNLQRAQELFTDRVITFSQWLLFRLVQEGGKRIMHVVHPN